MILGGDIGGTKCNLAAFEVEGAAATDEAVEPLTEAGVRVLRV